MSTITFAILDSSVAKENQVFDHLVQVRRLDTQEEGLLLCSHCCKWPEELIPQATWLEGCFTPEEWQEEPRLLTGYHPDHLVSWVIDWHERQVTLSLVHSVSQEDDEDAALVFPLPYTQLDPECKLYKRIDRYMRLLGGETWEEYLSNIFSATVRLHQRGIAGIDFLLGVASWVMNQVDGQIQVHYMEGEWIYSILNPFGENRSDTCYAIDENGMIRRGPSELLPTIPIRRRRQRFEDSIPQTKVYVSLPEYGWDKAESLPYFIDSDGLEVIRDVGDWFIARPLPEIYEGEYDEYPLD
jgi:hypothetical protein